MLYLQLSFIKNARIESIYLIHTIYLKIIIL